MSILQKIPSINCFGLPLYLGVELALGIAILNKMSGFYGLLSIFTGHPLDLSQWIFYFFSILIIPFYLNGLKNILKPKVINFAPILVLFSVDTLISLWFVIYFALEWLLNEDVKFEKKPGQDYSKSASENFEFGWIICTSIIIQAVRLYSTLVIFSFYKRLLRLTTIQGEDVGIDDIELDLKNRNIIEQNFYKIQIGCYKILKGKI
ncbi:hypothetical protein WICMUC_004379 [Wickerhamomyces mucosus]|uniref:Uncharacterized protein n=1 Tax=Wickerhamomyces mucosus TaxID=1378264 RepID=A0A9P8PJ68_9ASCO|nr:hypothetical protein WICMUC_004379 [Wickerhamomyces mucosus]